MNKLPDDGAFPLLRQLKLEVWAGIWKLLALFAKNGAGDGTLNPPAGWKVLGGCGGSPNEWSDPRRGGGGGKKGGPGGCWNKLLLPLLPLLLLLLLLLFLGFLMPLNLSRRFLISNSFPGWLGNDFIKSLSLSFF